MAVWAASFAWSADAQERVESVAQEQELPYQRYIFKTVGDQELEIWIHRPPGWKASDKRPAIVFFHGGGWKGGSPGAFERHAVYFASRGLVCARPYYRVKGREGVNPDKCVEDARSAVRWMRENAGMLGIDPNKLIASGSSAGGHLAACMIIKESAEAEGDDLSISTMPQAMVLYNPVLNCTREKMLERLDGDEAVARKISPTFHMTKDTPPAVIFFGSEDELKVHGDEYWAEAERLGVRADKFIEEGAGHAFHYRTPYRQKCLVVADRFLESLGFLEGPPTMTVPEGEELEALLEEDRIRREQKKAKKSKQPKPE
jgi:acetyl esterase